MWYNQFNDLCTEADMFEKKTAALLLTMILCFSACCAQALTMTGLETEYVERSW